MLPFQAAAYGASKAAFDYLTKTIDMEKTGLVALPISPDWFPQMQATACESKGFGEGTRGSGGPRRWSPELGRPVHQRDPRRQVLGLYRGGTEVLDFMISLILMSNRIWTRI